MIAKRDLVHGVYYDGDCRNACVARWNATAQKFYHWRTKMSGKYVETICHPDDEERYDVFIPESVSLDTDEIPFN